MTRETVFSGEVEYIQVLDEDGKVDEDEEPDLSDSECKEMYRHMVQAREFDRKALKMQRQGKFGTFAPCKGQEAAQVGSAFAIDKSDWLFPSFRETAALFTQDFPIHRLIQYWQGDERGATNPEDRKIAPMAVPVGTQLLHAVGTAWAAKKKGDPIASLTYFGDGATSEGDFHEALNFAGTFNIPTVFVCQNNQYAISLPRNEQTGAETLAQKALAYGFKGIQVDGNDVLAMWKATKEALENARKHNKPTLIEAYTYRLGDHTTADEASKYRDEDEVEEWKQKDPIERFEQYLLDNDIVDSDWIEQTKTEAEDIMANAVDKASEVDDPEIEDVFRYQFKEMTPALERQLEQLKSAKRGED